MPTVRVLMVGPSLAYLGGQAIQAQRMFQQLNQDAALQVTFLPVTELLTGVPGVLQRIKYVRTVVQSAVLLSRLLRTIPHCDVVHIFSASYWSFLVAAAPPLVVARWFGKPSILNYRSGEAEDHLRNWKSAVPLVRQATRILVPSGYLKEVFERFGFPAQVIANTVSTRRFKFRRRQPLQPVFLSNRNFHSMYNVGNTLRAFALIQERYPEARLCVAGAGQQEQQLRELTADLQLRNVDFAGPVAPEQMPALCHQADIYLNSSEIDNMPTSLLEAFAAGLPVVTTRAGGIPYIVDHGRTGLLVDCGQPEQMAAAVFRLLQETGLSEAIIEQARQECAQYQWDVVGPQWSALYREMARK